MFAVKRHVQKMERMLTIIPLNAYHEHESSDKIYQDKSLSGINRPWNDRRFVSMSAVYLSTCLFV